MEQRRPAPGGGDPAVMAEYFETMRQFLETQERVMAAYMAGDAGRRRPRPAATAKRDAFCRAYAEAPVAVVPAIARAPQRARSARRPQAVRRRSRRSCALR